jgi:hypothetical protein
LQHFSKTQTPKGRPTLGTAPSETTALCTLTEFAQRASSLPRTSFESSTAIQTTKIIKSCGNDSQNSDRIPLAYLRDGVNNYDLPGTDALETRSYWYRPERQDPPRIVVPDGSREGFTFRLNETEARNIHNFNGLYDVTVNETELKALLAYLNSGVAERVVRNYTQTQQDGFEKLGPGAVKQLPVIDVTDMNNDMTTDLANLFDTLRETARRDGDYESVINRIDAVLQQTM